MANSLVVNQVFESSRSAGFPSLEAKSVEKNPSTKPTTIVYARRQGDGKEYNPRTKPTTIVYACRKGDAKREAGKEAQSRTGKPKLKVFADPMTPPSRAVIIFCRVNGIIHEEFLEVISKGKRLSPEFSEINPMKQLPAIVDGNMKLLESRSILIYLACEFPGVADHWYPADRIKRHVYVTNTTLLAALGYPSNQQAADEAEKLIFSSSSMIESLWLKGDEPFLLGGNQPSMADLSLVCELKQLEVLDATHRARLLGPYKKVQQWIEHTTKATSPHFVNVHDIFLNLKKKKLKKSH